MNSLLLKSVSFVSVPGPVTVFISASPFFYSRLISEALLERSKGKSKYSGRARAFLLATALRMNLAKALS